MPIFGTQIFGTSTDVTSLEQLQTLDIEARLSVEKRGEKDVLVATKGTLSDGLYSLWAYFRPAPARQARLDTLNHLKIKIINSYGKQAIFLFSLNLYDAKNFEDHQTSPLMRSALDIVFNDLAKRGEENQLLQKTAILKQCPDQDLAEALFDNQFLQQPELPKVSEGLKELYDKYNASLLDPQEKLTIENNASKYANEDFGRGNRSVLLSRMESLKTPATPEQRAIDQYQELGRLISNFRTNQLPEIQRRYSGKVEDDQNRAFKRNLKKFLSSRPRISEDDLRTYLSNYSSRYPHQQETSVVESQNVSASSSLIQKASEDIAYLDEVQAKLTKQGHFPSDVILRRSKTILSFPQLTNRIAAIGGDLNYQDFFQLLTQLSDSKTTFQNLEGIEVPLGAESKTFIDQLLGVFTIRAYKINSGEKQNPEVYDLFKGLGRFLVSHPQRDSHELTEEESQDATILKNQALQILQTNKSNEEKVKTFSTGIKEKVLAHQEAEKQWKEAVKTNPDAARPTMDYLSERSSAVREPLLSPDATDLLAFTILSLTPPEERAATQAKLTGDFGITFSDAPTSSAAVS